MGGETGLVLAGIFKTDKRREEYTPLVINQTWDTMKMAFETCVDVSFMQDTQGEILLQFKTVASAIRGF